MNKAVKKNKILGVIPARGGSKSISKKNIVNVNGHPLIAYTIAEAVNSKYLTNIVTSSDDDEIRAISEQYGCEAPFKRPKELSSDIAKSVECDLHATKFMEDKYQIKYDFIVELMCTNPLKTVHDIDNVIDLHIATNADSVIGVVKLEDHHPLRIKKIENGFIRDFTDELKETPESRRQDLKPDAYIRNGSIYSMRRDMLELGIRHGSSNSLAYIMPIERTVNIDEERDLLIAKVLLENNPRKYISPKLNIEDAKNIIKKYV